MKKFAAVAVALAVCTAFAMVASAADEAKAKPAPAVVKAPVVAPVTPAQGMPARPMGRANISMVYGTVTTIDTKDPSKIKLTVTSEMDKKEHVIEVIPTTTVTKVTDIAELKKGDNVRVMSRKIDDKDVAMGVMFGKIRKPAPMRPPAGMPPAPAAPAVKAQPKK